MNRRISGRRSSNVLELFRRLKEEYVNLTAEEDSTDDPDVWEECVRILHLAEESYSLQPETLMLVKICVVQIVRVLPQHILSRLRPTPGNLAILLLENVQNHDEEQLTDLLEWFVMFKTFPKLYDSTASEEEKQFIYNNVFEVVFKLIRKDNVKMLQMLELLSQMIKDSQHITLRALDVILYSLVQDQFDKPQAFAALLIQACQEDLSFSIDEVIFDQLLNEDLPEEKTKFARFGFQVINKLYRIYPCNRLCRAMTHVLREKRRNTESAVECLMKLFTEDGSALVLRLPKLWSSFTACVKKPEYRELFLLYCPTFFMKFGRYKFVWRQLVNILEQFSMDQRENVRLLTVKAVTNSVLLMPHLLRRNNKLFKIFKTLSSDIKENIRKEAIFSLGKTYAMFVKVEHFQDEAQIIVNFIMQEYGPTLYFNPKRELITAAINKYIVPELMNTETRMNLLVIMWTILDDESKRCFHNYLDIRKKVRMLMKNLKSLASAPDTAAVRDQRRILLQQMKFLASGEIYKRGNKEEKRHELQVLLQHMRDSGACESATQEMHSSKDVLTLIYELVCEYPDRIGSHETWNELVSLSHINTSEENIILMKLFASLPVEIDDCYMTEESDSFWISSLSSSTQQLKFGLKCICKHEEKFSEDIHHILRVMYNTPEEDEERYLRGILTLGYLAQYLQTNTYLEIITSLCDQVIQRQILHTTQTDASPNLRTWSKRSELPHNLRCKVEALKAITRIVSRRRNKALTTKTVDLLGTLVDRDGDYTQADHLGNMDKNWLRLTAGLSYLKICEDIVLFKSQIGVQYFFKMARLINDPIRQVRNRFIMKLGTKLSQFNKLNFGLVNHFLAYFCLCELEMVTAVKEESRKLLQKCIKDKRLMVWYITTVHSNPTREQVVEDFHLVLPEFSIQIAVTLLAHSIGTTAAEERKIYRCLNFLMTSLMDPKVSHSFPLLSPDYYKNIFTQIETSRDATDPNVKELNQKLHKVCKIGYKVLNKISRKPKDTVMPQRTELDGRFYILNSH